MEGTQPPLTAHPAPMASPVLESTAAAPYQQAQQVPSLQPVYAEPIARPMASPQPQAQPMYANPVGVPGAAPAGPAMMPPPVGPGPKGWTTPQPTAGSQHLQMARMGLLLFKVLTLVFSLITFAITASIDETESTDDYDYSVKWTDSKAAKFLFSAGLIAFIITLAVIAFLVFEFISKAPAGHFLKWAALGLLELLLASLIFGSACSMLSGLDDSSTCDYISKVCSKGRAAAAFGILTWLSLLASLCAEVAIMASAGFTRNI